MNVAEFIDYLRTQPQDLQVAYKCYSEQCLLMAEEIEVKELQEPRPDQWIGSKRSDKATQWYLLLPGN